MGTLFKRDGSRYWQAAYMDASGRRRYASTGTTSKREAERHLAGIVAKQDRLRRAGLDAADPLLEVLQKAVAEARKGRLTPARLRVHLNKVSLIANGEVAKMVSVGDWLKTWLAGKRDHVGDSTLNRYETSVNGIIDKLGQVASRDLHSLTPEIVEAMMSSFRNDGLRAATTNQKLADLRSALEEARNRGLVERNVAKIVKKLPEEDSVIRAPFTLKEVETLLGAADHEWRGFILMACFTGLRMSDLANVRPKDIDLQNQVLSLKMKKRKRGLTPKVVRVPLADPVIKWISAGGLPENPDDPVFPSLAAVPASTISTRFKRTMKKAKVPSEVELPGGIAANRTFHSLRHTFVTWLAEGDVPPEIRKQLAGHSTDKVHEIYTHRSTASLAAAINGLPSIAISTPADQTG